MIKVNDTVVFEGCESKVLVVGKDHLHIDWNDEYIEVKKDEVNLPPKKEKYPNGYLPKICYHLCEMYSAFTGYMEFEEPDGQQGYYWRKYLLHKRKHDYFVDKQIKLKG